jgi:phosphate transport system protein
MGGLAEAQLADSVRAVVSRDSELAQQVIDGDDKIDALELEANALVVRMLALRQPMANDLRVVLSALKTSGWLERIGDYAKNIAKRSIALNQMSHVPAPGLSNMARMTQGLIKDVLDAYLQNDAEKAVDVWRRDEEVDDLYNSLFRELLTYMMEDPRNITSCTHLLFMAKNIERMGDIATNIADNIHFRVTGETLEGARPKGADAAFTVLEPVTPKDSE